MRTWDDYKTHIKEVDPKIYKELQELIDLERYMTGSLYTESSDGRRFEWRKMIEKVKELGRPLTDEESKLFKIK